MLTLQCRSRNSTSGSHCKPQCTVDIYLGDPPPHYILFPHRIPQRYLHRPYCWLSMAPTLLHTEVQGRPLFQLHLSGHGPRRVCSTLLHRGPGIHPARGPKAPAPVPHHRLRRRAYGAPPPLSKSPSHFTDNHPRARRGSRQTSLCSVWRWGRLRCLRTCAAPTARGTPAPLRCSSRRSRALRRPS